jgi:hypothetical protein
MRKQDAILAVSRASYVNIVEALMLRPSGARARNRFSAAHL